MDSFKKKKKQHLRIIILSFVSLIVLTIFSISMGTVKVPFFEVVNIILSKVPFLNHLADNGTQNGIHETILLKIRIPRVLVCLLIGAGLSVSGTVYQGIFRNPMADPYVLGISSGAAFGATIAIITGMSTLWGGFGFVTVSAFISAIAVVFIVYKISSVGKKVPVTTLLLAGIAVNYFLLAAISFMMIFNRNQIEQIVFWTMGSVSTSEWQHLTILFPVVLAEIVIMCAYSKNLNILSLGEENAIGLGVEIEKVKRILILVSSITVAVCVSVAGIIGFIGLIIPHSVKLLLGSDHKLLIPCSALGGAIFLTICDLLARSLISPAEIPVGIVTSLFGAPYFLFLLVRNKKGRTI